MRLNKTEREDFRKNVKILIPQMEKSEVVNQLKQKAIPVNDLLSNKSYKTQRDNQ